MHGGKIPLNVLFLAVTVLGLVFAGIVLSIFLINSQRQISVVQQSLRASDAKKEEYEPWIQDILIKNPKIPDLETRLTPAGYGGQLNVHGRIINNISERFSIKLNNEDEIVIYTDPKTVYYKIETYNPEGLPDKLTQLTNSDIRSGDLVISRVEYVDNYYYAVDVQLVE